MTRQQRLLVFALAATACVGFAHAGAIHARAWLAPLLLAHSWHSASAVGVPPPWPWADTRVAARLLAPSLGIERFVLDNDRPGSLAFGPGFSQRPAALGNRVISGHRDTHFAFLQALQPGMPLVLDEGYGGSRHFRVAATAVVDSRNGQLPLPEGASGLVLVTCFPFAAVQPGGPLRFVVIAEAEPRKPQRAASRALPAGASFREATRQAVRPAATDTAVPAQVLNL